MYMYITNYFILGIWDYSPTLPGIWGDWDWTRSPGSIVFHSHFWSRHLEVGMLNAIGLDQNWGSSVDFRIEALVACRSSYSAETSSKFGPIQQKELLSDIKGGCQKQAECRRVQGTDGKAALRIGSSTNYFEASGNHGWQELLAGSCWYWLMYCTSWVVASFPSWQSPSTFYPVWHFSIFKSCFFYHDYYITSCLLFLML